MKSLADMKIGERGAVLKIDGAGAQKRLETLGIREGSLITKVGSMLFRGPVVVKAGGCQIALGYGMAKKIMVEVKE